MHPTEIVSETHTHGVKGGFQSLIYVLSYKFFNMYYGLFRKQFFFGFESNVFRPI